MTVHPELAQRWYDLGRISTRAFHEIVREDFPTLTWPQTVHALRSELGMDIREARKTEAADRVDNVNSIESSNRKTLEDLEKDGRAQWAREQIKIANQGRWARLAYVSDQHRPYHVPEAVELALKIIEDFKPDVIPGLSDFFDFAPFRRTAEGNALFSELWPGGLVDAIDAHGEWSRDVKSAAPDARLLSILGNHDHWLWQFLSEKARGTAEFTLTHFVQEMVDQGLIWMGSELDEVELSPGFMMLHGKFATKNVHTALMNTLDNYGYQVSAIMGHGHREEMVIHKGKNYNTTAAMSGCLCSLKAHYSRHRTKWTHGIVLGFYEPMGYGVSLYNVSFHRIRDTLVAHWGDKAYQVKLTNATNETGALALAA